MYLKIDSSVQLEITTLFKNINITQWGRFYQNQDLISGCFMYSVFYILPLMSAALLSRRLTHFSYQFRWFGSSRDLTIICLIRNSSGILALSLFLATPYAYRRVYVHTFWEPTPNISMTNSKAINFDEKKRHRRWARTWLVIVHHTGNSEV